MLTISQPVRKNQNKPNDRIVVAINSLTSTTQAAYSNHLQVFYRLGRSYPTIDFCLVNPARMSIDRMRNMAAEVALDIEAKYLLFLDDDVLVPQPFDFLDKLIKCDADIAAADVIIRGYPFDHMLFTYTDKTRSGLKLIKKLPPLAKRGVIQVDAVGFSLCLIKVSLLKEIQKPFFVTGPQTNTEDIYFCVKVREKFPKCKIVADTSIVCGHILWNEVISSDNKKNYTKYYDAQYSDGNGNGNGKMDRGDAYLKIIKGGLSAHESKARASRVSN